MTDVPAEPTAASSSDPAARFQALARALAGAQAEPSHRRLRLADLADHLRALPPESFRDAVAAAPDAPLDADTLNHVAGMIELAAERRGQAPPPWTARVPPAPLPSFASALGSVRLHLLTRTPVALRRRNIFADASLDDRV